MYSLKNTHNHKKSLVEKRTLWNSAKKSKKNFPKKNSKNAKKISPKKISKKIEERLPRFSRSPIGGGGCIYRRNGRCVFIRLQQARRQAQRQAQRLGDIKQRAGKGKIHPICLFVWSLSLVVLLWFGSLWFVSVVRLIGSDFLLSIKKFFNFPIFFHNCLIFNAFQI